MTTESQPTKADLWASLESESGDASGSIEARPSITQQESTQPAATSPAHDAGQSGQAGNPFENLDPAVRDTLSGLQTMVGQLTTRLRQAEGHIGGLKSSLQQQIQAAQAVASRGGDAPSRDQLHAATGSASAMARLKEDYPEFAGAMDAALNERLSTVQAQPQQSPGVSPADVEARIDEMRRQMHVEMKHPGWLDDVKTPRFTGWLDGQAAEVKMLANSAAPSDAIRLLDLFKQTTAGAAQQQASFNAAAALPGRRSSQAPRAVDPNAMTKDEYWAYLDSLDKQKA